MLVPLICICVVMMIGIPISIPTPECIENGLSQIGMYVTRLANSRAASLSIFTLDGNRGFGLNRDGSGISINLYVDWKEPEKEQAIRAFFAQRNVAPTQDYLASNGGVMNATRILSYPVRSGVQETIEICGQVLRQIYSLTESKMLGFTYEKNIRDEMIDCLRTALDTRTSM